MSRRAWTDEEVEVLRRRYANDKTADIAADIGRPLTQVYAAAGRLGLCKSEAFAASSSSGRILRGGILSVETQFKPGLVPWNKGGHHVAGGRSAETRFAKGNKPHTWRPVGSTRINTDGYLDRKVNDLPGGNHIRWHPVHRLVWEAVNGPVPAGHVVVFKPGRFTTVEAEITIDAVELVTRSELLRRNSIHNLPPEIVSVLQLRGTLTRAIHQREKDAPGDEA